MTNSINLTKLDGGLMLPPPLTSKLTATLHETAASLLPSDPGICRVFRFYLNESSIPMVDLYSSNLGAMLTTQAKNITIVRNLHFAKASGTLAGEALFALLDALALFRLILGTGLTTAEFFHANISPSLDSVSTSGTRAEALNIIQTIENRLSALADETGDPTVKSEPFFSRLIDLIKREVGENKTPAPSSVMAVDPSKDDGFTSFTIMRMDADGNLTIENPNAYPEDLHHFLRDFGM